MEELWLNIYLTPIIKLLPAIFLFIFIIQRLKITTAVVILIYSSIDCVLKMSFVVKDNNIFKCFDSIKYLSCKIIIHMDVAHPFFFFLSFFTINTMKMKLWKRFIKIFFSII